jgi:hypothetical protein
VAHERVGESEQARAGGEQPYNPMLAVGNCIRRHGPENFPDPTTSSPPPLRSAHGNAIGGPGAYLALPPPSQALSRAEAACGFRIP